MGTAVTSPGSRRGPTHARKIRQALGRRAALAIARIPLRKRAGYGWLTRQWLIRVAQGGGAGDEQLCLKYTGSDELQARGLLKKQTIRPERSDPISIPERLPERLRRTLSELSQIRVQADFVVELDGLHLGPEGDCMVREGEVLNDLWVNQTTPPCSRDRLFAAALARPSRRLSRPTTSLCIPYAKTYAHWMYQAIPKLGILEAGGVKLSELDVLMPADAPEWMVEIAGAFGVRPERMIFTGREAWEGRLVIANAPQIQPANETIAYLRGKTAALRPMRDGSRIFLHRPTRYGRRVLNEQALLALTEMHGLEPVDPAGLSFHQQVALFARADMIVALHGSALTNIVFGHPATTVIELFPTNHVGSAFYAVARRLGLRHHALLGTEPKMPRILDRAFRDRHPGYYNCPEDDIIAPIGELEKILRTIGR